MGRTGERARMEEEMFEGSLWGEMRMMTRTGRELGCTLEGEPGGREPSLVMVLMMMTTPGESRLFLDSEGMTTMSMLLLVLLAPSTVMQSRPPPLARIPQAPRRQDRRKPAAVVQQFLAGDNVPPRPALRKTFLCST